MDINFFSRNYSWRHFTSLMGNYWAQPAAPASATPPTESNDAEQYTDLPPSEVQRCEVDLGEQGYRRLCFGPISFANLVPVCRVFYPSWVFSSWALYQVLTLSFQGSAGTAPKGTDATFHVSDLLRKMATKVKLDQSVPLSFFSSSCLPRLERLFSSQTNDART